MFSIDILRSSTLRHFVLFIPCNTLFVRGMGIFRVYFGDDILCTERNIADGFHAVRRTRYIDMELVLTADGSGSCRIYYITLRIDACNGLEGVC